MGKGCHPLSCACGYVVPMRFVVASFCVFGIVVGYGQRQCLNVAITRLVPPSAKNYSNECPRTNHSLYGEEIGGGHFLWSEQAQGYILASFFMGYFIGQVPAGITADLLSGRYTYLAGVGMSTLLSALFPIIIWYLPWYCVCAGRTLMGIVQAVTYPSTGTLLAHWIPPYERATLGAFSFAANSLGTVLGNLLTGMCISYTRYWPTAFYFWGLVGIIWCVGVFTFVHDSPDKHPYIMQEEKELLKRDMIRHSKLKVPWKKLFSDHGIWALIIGQIGHDFTLYFIVTNMPKYFRLWLSSIVSGKICDYGIKCKDWNVNWCRKAATFVGYICPSVALVLMVYVGCSAPLAVTCFAFACFSKGPHYAGFRINHMDITINFSGIVTSIVNTSGCISGFLCPIIVSRVAPNNRISEWKYVMWIIFGFATVFTSYYFVMGRAKRVEWDVPENELEEFREYKRKHEEEKKLKKERKKAKKEERKRKKEEGKATTSKD
ncbi:hypothetical protein Trydic_g3315 [Trypoxylus dichotomus]